MAQILLKVDLSPNAMLVLNDLGGGGSGITQAAADLRYLKLAADNDPLTGTLDTQAIQPAVTGTYDLGASTLRWKDIYGQRLNNTIGTWSSYSVTGNYLASTRAGTGTGTKNLSISQSNPNSNHLVVATVDAAAGGTSQLTVGGRFNTFLGACVNSSGAGTATVTLDGFGHFGSGAVEGAGATFDIDAAAEGIFMQARVVGGSVVANNTYGSFLQGYAVSSGAGPGLIQASSASSFYGGMFLQGAAVDGTLAAEADAAFVQGYAINNSTISVAPGASAGFARGAALDGDITASAIGATAMGVTASGFDITASGRGSLALGEALAAITASGVNSIQLGPGVNAEDNTMKIGVAGLRLKGTAGAPGTPVNGDMYMSGGYVVVQSNGVAVNIEPAGAGLTSPQVLARTLGA